MKIKKKKPALSSLKRDCWKVFSRYIRRRDCFLTTGSTEYGECISCDGHFTFNQLDAGHFIQGRHNANLFSERGVHAQCRSCNRFNGGKPLEYRRQIIKLYGEGADEQLEEEARVIKKFTIPELEDMIKDYTKRLKEMEG